MDKKQKIIDAAILVFARDGLEKGRIADIAKEAGIGKGTVYEYFRSKDEIFLAIETGIFEEFELLFQNLVVESLSPSEKLKHFMAVSIEQFQAMDDAMLILIELWAHAGRGHWHGSDSSQFAKYYERYKESIKSILDAGIKYGEFREMNKDGVAALLMAFLDGLVWQMVMMKDKNSFQTVKEEAIQSFMKGILK